MAQWNNDKELFALVKERLYTPVVGNILDGLGCYHQFLLQGVCLLRGDMKPIGRAIPVLIIDVYEPQKRPFGLLTEALDQLGEDEIYLTTGDTKRCAYWGKLLTATARTKKAVGTIVNGWYRDAPQVLEQNWPMFSRGCYAQDFSVRTQVVDFRCPIEFGDVWVNLGDIAFGDTDGVLIISQKCETEVFEKTLEKAAGGKVARKTTESGTTATAALAKFGTL